MVASGHDVYGYILRPVALFVLRAGGAVFRLHTRESVGAWVAGAQLRPEQHLFPSRARISPHLSTRQYGRTVDRWVASIGLEPAKYGTHTMRRTKATLIYRRTKNLRAVQLLLGHTKLESTVRYLGIEVDDALEIAEQTEV